MGMTEEDNSPLIFWDFRVLKLRVVRNFFFVAHGLVLTLKHVEELTYSGRNSSLRRTSKGSGPLSGDFIGRTNIVVLSAIVIFEPS